MDERMRHRRSVVTIMVVVGALVGLPGGPAALAGGAGVIAPEGGGAAWPQEMGPPVWVVRLREQERQAQEEIEDLNRHRQELAELARQKEMEMREIEEAQNAQQREIQAQLREIEEDHNARQREVQAQLREMEEFRKARQRQIEAQMQAIEESTSAQQREIQAQRREIQEEMAGAERGLAEVERRREEARRRLLARAQEESAKLAERLHSAQAQAEQMQQILGAITPGVGGAPRPRLRRPEMPREPFGPVLEMREQLGDIRMQLRENNERVERLESRRPPRPAPALKDQVEQLGSEIGRLSEGFGQMQKSIDALSSQRCRGTVGSAGYNGGWQPYPSPHYYLY